MAEARLPGGYTGNLLRINLTNEKATVDRWDAEAMRKYVGGAGLGAKILYEEVPADVNWNDPENRLILATGPLAGTPVWGSGSLDVVTRGAMTDGAASTQANGFFGTSLKYSGYDAIILQGRAKRWSYIYIRDDDVRILDASHLLGKDTWEMQDAVLAEWGLAGHQMSVYGIGPAGENLVRFACILGDYGHAASQNGVGAVMGSKQVKLVAIVKGTRGIGVSDPLRLFEVSDAIGEELKVDPSSRSCYEYGTLPGVVNLEALGALPIKNYNTNVYPDRDKLADFAHTKLRQLFPHRGHQCNACGMHHCHMNVLPDGPHAGELADEPEYEGLSGCGATIYCTDPVAVTWLATQVDKAGVNINEWGWLCGWVMECFEKGYITREQLGFDVPWGDAEAAARLLWMVARREGFGNILAEGTKRAAEHLGGEAYKCAVFTGKGASPRGHDHRGRWEELLDTCVSSTGTLATGPLVRPPELGIPARRNPFDGEETATAVALGLGRRDFEDSLGTCIFTTRTTLENLAKALSATTGWDFTKDEALQVGRRVANTFRAFNLRCGIGRELEKPSPRYGSTPVDGPAAGQSILPHWDSMIETYYRTVGWDPKDGKPLPETLRGLKLDHLVEDLWGKEAAAH